MLHRIDTVLFDFDGTLVEVSIDFAEMRRGVLSLGLEYDVSPKPDLYILESIGDIFENLLQRDADQANDFKRRAEKLIIDIEMEAATRAKMIPGADKTLTGLRDRGVKVGIVTRNCRSAVMKASKNTGFVYDLLLTRDDVKKAKPDPQHLLDALALLNSKPENSLMVGDHPLDILAGKKAGMKTAAVLTTKSSADFCDVAPDIILTCVSNLLTAL